MIEGGGKEDTRYFGFSSLGVAYSTECIRFQWMGFVPVRGIMVVEGTIMDNRWRKEGNKRIVARIGKMRMDVLFARKGYFVSNFAKRIL